MSKPPADFCWYELMTTDLPAASRFYQAVVGWQTKDSGMSDRTYHLIHAGERGIGGMMALTEQDCAQGKQSGWMGYIAVDDTDATVGRLLAAGGALHRPAEDIPGVGRFAVVADLHGAVFVLFTPADMSAAPPPAAPGTLGHIGWHELHAGDGVAAFAFYSSLFGWTKGDAMDMGPLGVYQLFKAGGELDIGGMMTKMADTPFPCWQFYINVEGIQAAVARVKAAGGSVLMDPHEVPGGNWIAPCVDPQGAVFALLAQRQ